jgi:hypothetical protein
MRDGLRCRQAGDMSDQRIEGRAALGGIDGRDGGRIRRVGGKAIDGLGRQDDQPAVRQSLGGIGGGAQSWASM